jgi:hypothetical protein
MSPFIGNPIGFNPATLALLDTALTDICADFERANVRAFIAEHVAAPVVSEIDVTPIIPPKSPASIRGRKRWAKRTADGLCFNKARGWYLR